MSIQSKLELKNTFKLSVSPCCFSFNDTTDYTSEGISLSNVKGVLSVIGPTGQIYLNTNFASPDIDPSVSRIKSSILIPLDTDNLPFHGEYRFVYTIRVSGGVQPGDYSIEYVGSYAYERPAVLIKWINNPYSAYLAANDNTAYVSNGVLATVTRVNTLKYPPLIAIPNYVTTEDFVAAYSDKYFSGEYFNKVESTLLFDFGSYLVDDQVSGESSFDVADIVSIADVYCCVKALNSRAVAQRGINNTLYSQLNLDFINASSLLNMAEQASQIGAYNDVDYYLDQVRQITGCTSGCNCSSGSGQQVLPINKPQQGGGSISLTTNGNSGAATYDGSVLNIPVYSLAGLGGVPYTGANQNLNMGSYSVQAASFFKSGGLASEFLKANGSVDSTVYYPASNPFNFITSAALAAYLPYIGANQDLNMGVYSVAATGLTLTGLTASRIVATNGSKAMESLTGTGLIRLLSGAISYDTNTYLTTISGISAGGELSGTYPNPILLNSAVISKVLTGLNLGAGGSISATDTIIEAFGKIQNSISSMLGGVIYQGVWDASTNTPTIPTPSPSNKGWYYIVNVAGSTNIGGITDWQVGDWIISNGTTWSKVDNTDAVSSVNGFTGAVSLTTSNISEGSNLYYTDARSRLAISDTVLGIDYDSSTGIFSTQSGYGIPTTVSQSQWDSAYTNRITSLTTTGSSGASTLSSNVLNVPTYTLAGLGATASTISAQQTFTLAPIFSAMTSGSVLFAGTSGVLSQDNGKFNYLPTGYNSNAFLLINATAGTPTAAGTLHVRGSGTGSNNAGIFETSAGNAILRIREDGFLRFGGNANAPSMFTTAGSVGTNAITGTCIGWSRADATGVGSSYSFSDNLTTITSTSNLLTLSAGITVSSGSNSYTWINLQGTINQTGTATNVLTGININHTFTSVYNYRALNLSGTLTPNAAITTYSWTNITPTVAASVNNQIIIAQDITLAGSDGAFTGVVRNALRLSGGVLQLATVAGDYAANNGAIWYNTSTNKFRARENGATVDLIGAGGGGITFAQGQMISSLKI